MLKLGKIISLHCFIFINKLLLKKKINKTTSINSGFEIRISLEFIAIRIRITKEYRNNLKFLIK